MPNRTRRNHMGTGALPPRGSVVYDPDRDMSYINGTFRDGRQADAVTVVKRSGRGFEEIGVGAYNSDTAKFYRVVLTGKAGEPVFPTPGAKSYYVKCLANALPYYPVEIESYSVTNNAAFFVIASFDQTEISLRRFLSLVNATYIEYFNEVFDHSGSPFRSRPAIKRLKSASDAAENIVLAERQPYVRGEVPPGGRYPYSSADERGEGFSAPKAFAEAFGKDGLNELKQAREDRARPIFAVDLVGMVFSSVDKLDDAIENTLIDFGCFTKKKIPNDIMPKVIAEVNERSAAPYDKICKKLAISGGEKYTLLTKTIEELIINSKRTFDYAWDALGVTELDKKPVAVDIIIELSDRLGYSIDQIFAMMGFLYCGVVGGIVQYYNDELVVEIIRFLSRSRRQPIESVIASLGIRDTFEDPSRVRNIASMARN